MVGHTQITERLQEVRSKVKTRTDEIRERVKGMRTGAGGRTSSQSGSRVKGQVMTKVRARISSIKSKRLAGRSNSSHLFNPPKDPAVSDTTEQIFPLDTEGGFTKAPGVFKLR